MSVWMHKRRGRIVGVEVPQDEASEWMFVTLDEPVRGARDFWDTGETMTLRRSFMTLVPEPSDPS
jgi:hypothetical protein